MHTADPLAPGAAIGGLAIAHREVAIATPPRLCPGCAGVQVLLHSPRFSSPAHAGHRASRSAPGCCRKIAATGREIGSMSERRLLGDAHACHPRRQASVLAPSSPPLGGSGGEGIGLAGSPSRMRACGPPGGRCPPNPPLATDHLGKRMRPLTARFDLTMVPTHGMFKMSYTTPCGCPVVLVGDVR